MLRPDWRSPSAYEDKRKLDAPGFAFEFLRRNRAFLRDYKRLSEAHTRNDLSDTDREIFAQRWGLRFREADRRQRECRGPLDGDGSTQCGCGCCPSS